LCISEVGKPGADLVFGTVVSVLDSVHCVAFLSISWGIHYVVGIRQEREECVQFAGRSEPALAWMTDAEERVAARAAVRMVGVCILKKTLGL
jgi:hypothetical protein